MLSEKTGRRERLSVEAAVALARIRWRSAVRATDEALAAWRRAPGGHAYARYREAAEREDAAHTVLERWWIALTLGDPAA